MTLASWLLAHVRREEPANKRQHANDVVSPTILAVDDVKMDDETFRTTAGRAFSSYGRAFTLSPLARERKPAGFAISTGTLTLFIYKLQKNLFCASRNSSLARLVENFTDHPFKIRWHGRSGK